MQMKNSSTVNQHTSGYHRFSYGIVVQNKELNSHTLIVAPIETSIGLTGELAGLSWEFETDGVTYLKKSNYKKKVSVKQYLEAEWRCTDPLRKTSPDLRRGDIVEIYQVADTNRYFWQPFNTGQNARLETVVEAISGSPDEDVPLDNNNCYTRGMSTHEKFFNIAHTSKANKEKYTYDVFIDTKEGCVVIKDDIGNHIRLRSKDHHILLENTDKSKVELIGEHINIYSKKTVNIETETLNIKTKDINTSAKNSINTDSKTNTTKTHKSYSVLSSGTYSTSSTGVSTISSSSNVNMASPTVSMVAGSVTNTGDGGSPGVTNTTGVMNINGDVVINGVSMINHRHNTSRGDTGGPF